MVVPWKQSHPQARGPGLPCRACPKEARVAGRSPGLSGRGTRAKRAGVDGVAFCRVSGARRAEGALILQTKQSGRKNSWWLFARRALGRSGSPRLRRAGHCSPYRFALMIFLKERDSCEQTGLTGLLPPPRRHPQGISFCLRLTSKSVIGPSAARRGGFGRFVGASPGRAPRWRLSGPRGVGGRAQAGPC